MANLTQTNEDSKINEWTTFGIVSLLGDNLKIIVVGSVFWTVGAISYWILDSPTDILVLSVALILATFTMGSRLGYVAREHKCEKPIRVSIGVAGILAGLWVFTHAFVETFATDFTATVTVNQFPTFFLLAFVPTVIAFSSGYLFALIKHASLHMRDVFTFLSLIVGMIGLIFSLLTYFGGEPKPDEKTITPPIERGT